MSERVVHRAGMGRRRAARTVALLSAAVVVILAACGGGDFTSDDDGAGGSSTGGGSDVSATASSAGGMGSTCEPIDEGACSTCMLDQCTEPACACWANADCVEIYACYAETCPEGIHDECLKNCLDGHIGGVSLAAFANDCALSRCTVDCGTVVYGNALDDCELCAYTECAEQMNACYGFHVCFDLVACLDDCASGDVMCAQECKSLFPAGENPLAAVIECAGSKCPQCK